MKTNILRSFLICTCLFVIGITAAQESNPKQTEQKTTQSNLLSKQSLSNIKYTSGYFWIRDEGEYLRIGITDDYLANNWHGHYDVVYIDLPCGEGEELNIGDIFGSIESTAAVTDLLSPIEGVVVQTNELLMHDPALIRSDPYKDGWLILIKKKISPQDSDPQDPNIEYPAHNLWVRQEGDLYRIGIAESCLEGYTQYNQLSYIDLPQVGDEFEIGDVLAEVESVAAIYSLESPFAGVVVEVNELLNDEPDLAQSDPYGDGWIMVVRKTSDPTDPEPENPDPENPENPNNPDPDPTPTPVGKGVTVTYDYNVRSWTTNISSPHFTQKLYYNESNGKNTPQYNGNISAIEWNNGTGNNNRAYDFAYDQLSRLTGANYTGANNKEKYGTSYTYDKHGNMLSLMREGRTSNSKDDYGLVDQLSFSYNGNQLTAIKDDISLLYNNSADFKGEATEDTHYTFNRNGAMTKDLNKGITKIEYNSLNLPMSIEIDASSVKGRTKYLYSATGAKLRVIHETDMNVQNTTVMAVAPFESEITDTKVTDYVGNKIYENGKLKKILVDGGYYDCEKEEYFFYIQDHLGNNRVVVNSNDSVVQRSDYYPFGMEFADNTNSEEQPYKYNGKELDKTHGLNMYDYSARYVDPAYGRFTTIDPHAENYFAWSPYVYCGNNPLRITDPTGMDWFVDGETGMVIYVRGVGDLTELDNDQLEMYGIGNIDSYERLGADNMFGDDVSWGGEENILESSFFNMLDNSASFMNSQGYKKAENVEINEMKVTLRLLEYNNQVKDEVTVNKPYQIGDSKITYVTPDKINTASNVERKKPSTTLGTKIEVVSYNLIKGYGEGNGNNRYLKSKGQYMIEAGNMILKEMKNIFGNAYIKGHTPYY